jgi:hypothetical protein
MFPFNGRKSLFSLFECLRFLIKLVGEFGIVFGELGNFVGKLLLHERVVFVVFGELLLMKSLSLSELGLLVTETLLGEFLGGFG